MRKRAAPAGARTSPGRATNKPSLPVRAEQKKEAPRRQRLPRVYGYYLVLLVLSLAFFSLMSMRGEDFPISLELKRMDFGLKAAVSDTVCDTSRLVGSEDDTTLASDTVAADTAWADTAVSVRDVNYEYLIDTVGDSGSVKFLLIGDSMNEFLRLRLNDYCIANGHRMECVIWYGATTKQYGTSDTIAYFIRKFRPTYVLLTIGANELFIRDIAAKRTPYVQHIVRQLGNIPYVWVGPPNWKEDTGINELIVSHVGASKYFESKKLSFDRCKDGAHPTRSSAFRWMDSIALFLSSAACHTVPMVNPDTLYNKVPHTTILQMVRE